MDCEGSRGFAIYLRACDLIRELEQKIGETAAGLRNGRVTNRDCVLA